MVFNRFNQINLLLIITLFNIPLVFSVVEDLTSQTKSKILGATNKPLVIDFYSDSCGPCRSMKPILEDLSNANSGKYSFGKINVESSNELSRELGIRSIPTFVVVQNGKIKGRFVGYCSKKEFLSRLENIVNS